MLRTFVLVNNDKVVSPLLTTIREYGDWFEKEFPYPVSQMELYLKVKTSNGERVLERHPGTKIGNFFKNTRVSNAKLVSWYIPPNSETLEKLIKLGMAEKVDGRLELRVYTVDQLEFYIKTNVDSSYNISSAVAMPKQVRISDAELMAIKKPQLKTRNKKLFQEEE